MKRFTSLRKEKRKSAAMATEQAAAPAVPSRQETLASTASDEAVPDTDPGTVCCVPE